METPVIQVRNLSRRFGDLVAVDDVTFAVRRAAIFGLLGPNGSGKSTIIRMLCGVLPPTSGDAEVLGIGIRNDPEAIKHHIGYMSQQFSLYGDLSVRENIDFYSRVYGLPVDQRGERAEAVLELTSLSDRREQLASTLSGGWKQRLALACALVHEPEVIFLDEPTAGIDPVARRTLWDLLFELSARGVTLFVTTHYMDEAERCTEIGYLLDARLLVLGKPEQLKKLPQVAPPNTRRLELRMMSPARHLAALRTVPGVRQATLFGDAAHLLVDDHLDEKRLLSELGDEAGQAELRPIAPTLEDVFVALTSAASSADRVTTRGVQHEDVQEPGGSGADDGPRGRSVDTADTTPVPSDVDTQRRRRRGGHGGTGFLAVLLKEFAHVQRQPTTLFFMLFVPVLQTLIFGYAIDTQIENITTVVYDMDGRQASRELADSLQNTRVFNIVRRVHDQESFRDALQSGRASVGLRIPPDFTDHLLRGEQVYVQVLIDGSDAQVATTALNAAKLLGIARSIELAREKGETLDQVPARNPAGRIALPIEVRARLLYNPDLESARFFVPGLVGIILQLVTLFLTAFAVVRERELGTLEQLFVTPVGRAGLLFGKLVPYAIVGFVETLVVLCVMVYLFDVPIHGSLALLLSLSGLFLVCSLALGLLVSTLAKTQTEALQYAFIIMLPSVLLSGFMFPRSEMPDIIYYATFAIPVTYFIEILRGIVLRGAELPDLIQHVVGLAICCVVILLLSVRRFRKQLV